MFILESLIVFNSPPTFDYYIFWFGNFFRLSVTQGMLQGMFHLQQSNANIQFYCDNSMSEYAETE